MEKNSCRLIAREDWKECGFIMKSESHYLLDENKVLHENILYKLNTRKIVLLVASIIGAIILGHAIIALCMPVVHIADVVDCIKATVELVEETTQEVKAEEAASQDSSEQLFMEKCSTEYLVEEDFYDACGMDGDLREKLQYFINYIYARNGHAFQEGGAVDSLFQEESWYKEMSEKRIVTYENLNRYEQKNIDTMVTIMKKEGYR